MTLKFLAQKNLAIVIALSVIFFVSCQGGNKSANKEQTKADSVKISDISANVKEVVYPLPTPFQMTKMLNDMGARYALSSLNPVDKAGKYFTEKSKAVNLGVYGADLAYAASYDQKQDVKLYSKALKTLIDELGINIDYSTLLSDEFKEKINNKDTLVKIVTNTFYDTYKYLNQKSNPDLSVMMVSGMWIELMYIATHISEDTYHNSGIVKLVVNQKDSYNKLMSLLKSQDSNAEIKDVETKLLKLQPVFDKIDSGLQEKDYLLILQTIQSVRKSFVS
jgi:hypothetical protein